MGVLNTTFENTGSAGLCLTDINGACEELSKDGFLKSPDMLFKRSTTVGDVIKPGPPFFASAHFDKTSASRGFDEVLGVDVSQQISVDVRDSKFSNLSPPITDTLDSFSGLSALHLESVPTAMLSALTFSGNRARQGGAVHLDTVGAGVIWNSTFTNNSAASEGGAICIGMVSSHGSGLLIGASTLSHNSAWREGAIYGGPGTYIKITDDTTIQGNHAATRGGAVYCESAQLLWLLYSTVVANTADRQAGHAAATTVWSIWSIHLALVRTGGLMSL